jgi:hypothetical protein|uniref:Uncharacterized protein n=1 Tax=viral metagenome TaxID=1070528 RepID=A0A6C0BFF7_9ZZZZ
MLYDLPLCHIQVKHDEINILDVHAEVKLYCDKVLYEFTRNTKLDQDDMITITSYLDDWYDRMKNHYMKMKNLGKHDYYEEYHGSCKFPNFSISTVFSIF